MYNCTLKKKTKTAPPLRLFKFVWYKKSKKGEKQEKSISMKNARERLIKGALHICNVSIQISKQEKVYMAVRKTKKKEIYLTRKNARIYCNRERRTKAFTDLKFILGWLGALGPVGNIILFVSKEPAEVERATSDDGQRGGGRGGGGGRNRSTGYVMSRK